MYTGWLSPTGDFIKTNEYAHHDIALKLVEQYNLFYDYNKHCDETLLNFNWCKICISRPQNTYKLFYNNYLTDYQKNWIKDKVENISDFIMDSFHLYLFELECK